MPERGQNVDDKTLSDKVRAFVDAADAFTGPELLTITRDLDRIRSLPSLRPGVIADRDELARKLRSAGDRTIPRPQVVRWSREQGERVRDLYEAIWQTMGIAEEVRELNSIRGERTDLFAGGGEEERA